MPADQTIYPMVHPETFKQNPLINHIKEDPYWTVSDTDKRPIDAYQFLNTGEMFGAKFDHHHPLVTLNDLDEDDNLQAVNRTYRMRSRVNRIIMVDVEPEAPEAVKHAAWSFPANYTELSANDGVHLLIQVPEDCIDDDSRYLFNELSVFKEPVDENAKRKASFEVIFNDHFGTFTKRMATDKPSADFEHNTSDKTRLKAFIRSICEQDKERQKQREIARQYRVQMLDEQINPDKKDQIEEFIHIKPFQAARENALNKKPEDYGYNMSDYEMSVACGLAAKVISIRSMARKTNTLDHLAENLSDFDMIYAVYMLMDEIVEYRDKHDEERDDLPWLMYTAKRAYEYIKADREENRKQRHNK